MIYTVNRYELVNLQVIDVDHSSKTNHIYVKITIQNVKYSDGFLTDSSSWFHHIYERDLNSQTHQTVRTLNLNVNSEPTVNHIVKNWQEFAGENNRHFTAPRCAHMKSKSKREVKQKEYIWDNAKEINVRLTVFGANVVGIIYVYIIVYYFWRCAAIIYFICSFLIYANFTSGLYLIAVICGYDDRRHKNNISLTICW